MTSLVLIAVTLVAVDIVLAFLIARQIERGNTVGGRLRRWLAASRVVKQVK